jgi:hypothetical protein
MAGLTAGGALRALLVPAFILCGAGVSSRALGQGATDYPIPSSAREAYANAHPARPSARILRPSQRAVHLQS